MTRLRWAGLAALSLVLAACAGAPQSGGTPTRAPESPVSDSSPAPESSPASETPAGASSCRAMVDRMSPQEQSGLLFMVAITNDAVPDAATMQVITDHEIGSVVLLGNTTQGVEQVREFTDLLREEVGEDVLIAVDQEGGQVQRLQGPGFDSMPDAVEQAQADDLAADAQRWGEQLAEAGVNVNLAPVADHVPEEMASANEPVAKLRRGYSSDPDEIGAAVTDYVRGMSEAGVGTTLKHYPGLGRVVGNPDFADRVVDDRTTRDDPGLAPFATGLEAGASMLMVSSATYTKIDPDHQAVFSKVILQEMIRGDLNFDGVVISDDLGVAENLASVPVADRGWQFVAAGGDLVINADPAKAAAMSEKMIGQMQDDPEFAEQVATSATRVLSLKSDLGLVDCTP
ncbi:glycoside hydrolase family 3 N-terminal domain-containing protein [Enemella sp. A6]|uniref:glycoside hydrolase family 3 N-terminal domain-containing protein n=1 Tax=Enemella sp. A6 TaxID=3440152 RepID=UPI003EBE88F3